MGAFAGGTLRLLIEAQTTSGLHKLQEKVAPQKGEKGRKLGSWEIYRDLTLRKLELVVFPLVSCFCAETHPD